MESKGIITGAAAKMAAQQNSPAAPMQQAAQQSISAIVNNLLDSSSLRKRFDELLGKRAPQFISSICTLITGSEEMMQAFKDNPMSVLQAALKAATFDLPIDPSLGFAHILPFKIHDKKKDADVMTATFVPGYKGLRQLAMRTGAYSRIPDAVDVREGELVSYDRLTGDAVFDWIEDEDEREKKPIIGFAGYFRLKNGAEKTIYMSRKQIDAHEAKNRKGKYMTKGWRENWEEMAAKTVLRRLISKYGLMSIEYRDGDAETVEAAHQLIAQTGGDVYAVPNGTTIEADVNMETGEIEDAEITEVGAE